MINGYGAPSDIPYYRPLCLYLCYHGNGHRCPAPINVWSFWGGNRGRKKHPSSSSLFDETGKMEEGLGQNLVTGPQSTVCVCTCIQPHLTTWSYLIVLFPLFSIFNGKKSITWSWERIEYLVHVHVFTVEVERVCCYIALSTCNRFCLQTVHSLIYIRGLSCYIYRY